MFSQLSDRLAGVFDRLRGRGALSADDVARAMRDIRVALLEADVALPVVKTLIADIQEKAVGEAVVRSVSPAQMVVKIVHDHLVTALGGQNEALDLTAQPPVAVLLVGVQGSGKTTSAAKLAKKLVSRDKKRVLLASLDVHRPAAQEQLAALAAQSDLPCLEIKQEEDAATITRRALDTGREGGYDVIILDSAGRTSLDKDMMDEAATVRDIAHPKETLLVADAMTGQDAVRIAQSFHERLTLSGLILTRIDGDARGGAALSMRMVTGCPVKFVGTGEKIDDLEGFYPERIASRILGMGDMVSLVETASQAIDQEKAEKMARKMRKGGFDLNDLAEQLTQMEKAGGLSRIMSMLPGNAGVKRQALEAGIDESVVKRQKAIIGSMTARERQYPDIVKASRKRRIAAGAGASVQNVNQLLKQHKQMNRMMKHLGKTNMGKMDMGGMGGEAMFGGAGGFSGPPGLGKPSRMGPGSS